MIRAGQPVKFTLRFRDRSWDASEHRYIDRGPISLGAVVSLSVVFVRPDGSSFTRSEGLDLSAGAEGVAVYNAPAGEINQPRSWRVYGIADGAPSEVVHLWVLPAVM